MVPAQLEGRPGICTPGQQSKELTAPLDNTPCPQRQHIWSRANDARASSFARSVPTASTHGTSLPAGPKLSQQLFRPGAGRSPVHKTGCALGQVGRLTARLHTSLPALSRAPSCQPVGGVHFGRGSLGWRCCMHWRGEDIHHPATLHPTTDQGETPSP